MAKNDPELLQGTLDLLVLKVVQIQGQRHDQPITDTPGREATLPLFRPIAFLLPPPGDVPAIDVERIAEPRGKLFRRLGRLRHIRDELATTLLDRGGPKSEKPLGQKRSG